METQTPTHQPPSKKTKMSSTATVNSGDHPPKYKRRKVAIFFAYCGVGYQGMQKNPGAKTIEGDLEEALYQAGAVPESDRGQSRKYDFARSARTDKGVSAVGQVISGRFYVDPDGFIERLNFKLPEQILVFGYKRVTGSFHAKKFCDRRRYVYLFPVFGLDSSVHRDRESVLSSFGSGAGLVKCLECSERGRKVFGVVGKSAFGSKNEIKEIGSEENGKVFGVVGKLGFGSKNENVGMDGEEEIGIKEIGSEENEEFRNENGKVCGVVGKCGLDVELGDLKKNENEIKELGSSNENGEIGSGNEKVEVKSEFLYGEKERARFNRILKCYEGTHNFHNFTTRTKPGDPSAMRYIISFDADTTVEVDGIEFVKCEVVGQSFMLHQIRKMIGLAVAIMRGYAPESLIETAFRQDVSITVPMAPEVGLYLDECFFYSYNNKWNDSHEEVSMKDYTKEAEEFKMKYIYSHIASAEHKDGAVALWLHSLNYRNYPDLRFVSTDRTDLKNLESQDFLPGSNGGRATAENIIEVKDEESVKDLREGNGGSSTAENIEVKDIQEGNGGSSTAENIEVKDLQEANGRSSCADNIGVKDLQEGTNDESVSLKIVEVTNLAA